MLKCLKCYELRVSGYEFKKKIVRQCKESTLNFELFFFFFFLTHLTYLLNLLTLLNYSSL